MVLRIDGLGYGGVCRDIHYCGLSYSLVRISYLAVVSSHYDLLLRVELLSQG